MGLHRIKVRPWEAIRVVGQGLSWANLQFRFPFLASEEDPPPPPPNATNATLGRRAAKQAAAGAKEAGHADSEEGKRAQARKHTLARETFYSTCIAEVLILTMPEIPTFLGFKRWLWGADPDDAKKSLLFWSEKGPSGRP